MKAAILSIGDEFTHGDKIDMHAAWLSASLAQLTISTTEHRTVGDDRHAIARAIAELADGRDVLIVTGGLGPTMDDITRFGLGDVTDPGIELVMDDRAARHIEARFRRAGRPMPEGNLVQARRPVSATFIDNPHGTAPGIRAMINLCLVFVLPGPPREMHEMYRNHVAPELSAMRRAAGDDEVIFCSAKVQAFGIGESDAAARLGDILARSAFPLVGITVSQSLLTATVRATGARTHVEPAVAETADRIARAWEPYAYGRDDATLAASVGRLLVSQCRTLATAESCTGGTLGGMIVDVGGCSDYYRGGWVTYTNDLKMSELGVARHLLDRAVNPDAPGAVSADVACAMARGAIERARADFAIAITGIAGPDGGTDDKPVGTVFIAVGRKRDAAIETTVRRFRFPGDRSGVRDRSAKSALQMARWAIRAPAAQPLERTEEPGLLWQVPLEGKRA